MTALATQSFSLTLTITSGPQAGEIYKIKSNRITIGRAPENDIVINKDTKCSRNHAEISLTANGIFFQALNPKNPVAVMGQELLQGEIKLDQAITIGETQIKFSHNSSLASPTQTIHTKTRTKKPKGKSKMTFYIVMAVVLGGLFWLLSESPKKEEAKELVTEADEKKRVEEYNSLLKAKEKENRQRGLNTPQYKGAQSNYVKGFRDFNNAQYGRAMESFLACLSLVPQHVQCRNYYHLAKRKRGELVEFHLIQGRKYKEQSQFQKCQSEMRTVMTLVVDPTSSKYKEAQSVFKLCNRLGEGRF